MLRKASKLIPLPCRSFLYSLSFDLIRSGTRKEELLLDKKVLARMWILRKLLNDMNVIEAMEFIQDRMRRTNTNEEFMETMSQ